MAPKATTLLASVLLGATLLALTPGTSATATCPSAGNGSENFEGYTNFFSPPANCLYGVQNVNDIIVVDPIVGATNHIIQGTNGGVVPLKNPCSSVDNPSGGPITYAFRFLNGDPSGLAAGTLALIGFGEASGGATVLAAIYIDGPGNTGLYVKSGIGTQASNPFPGAPLLTDNTWYSVLIVIDDGTGGAAANCNAGSATAYITIGANTYGTALPIGNDRPLYSSLIGSSINTGSQAITHFGMQFDDLTISGYTTYTPGNVFCSSIGSTNFGYNFQEDVDRSGPVSIGGAAEGNTIVFHSGSTGLALLGKDVTKDASGASVAGSTHALNTTFKIESATDGDVSHFRTTYSFVSTFARGNGDTSGSFANALQAEFTEVGDVWHIETKSIIAGTKTSFGGVADWPEDPNDSHTYQFLVDTRTATPTVKVLNGAGGTIITNTLPSFFSGLVMQSQWFTTDNGNTFVDVTTGLSPSSTASRSTCIYDGEGTLYSAGGLGNGGGALPCTGTGCATTSNSATGSNTCSSVFCVDSTTVPDGFTATTFNGFLGLLMMTMTTAGGVFAVYGDRQGSKISGAAVAVFGAIGYLTAFYFGLLPLWPVVAAVIIAAGILVFKFTRSG